MNEYTIEQIELGDILPSPTNPRTIFDDAALADLAESIRRKGVMQPILVRPRKCDFKVEPAGNRWAVVNPSGVTVETCDDEETAQDALRLYWERQPQFELVAGERRWRASKLAKQEHVPAIVRDLDDRSALEFQVIENLQRADLSPMEEARGYRRMLDEYGYVADELAAKVGKSKGYIYARLKLVHLPPAAEQALVDGVFSVSIAELIARVPGAEARERLVAELLEEKDAGWFQPPTFREVKRQIEQEYMRELKGAPFDLADKKLRPSAGSCKACSKRTGNDKVSYPDSRADVCTDPSCYDQKIEAHQRREFQRYAAAGAEILTAEQSRALLGYGSLLNSGADQYVSLDEEYWDNDDEFGDETRAPRTFASILGDDVKIVAVGTDRSGHPHRLVLREAVEDRLREAGVDLPAPTPARPSQEERREQWREAQAEAARTEKRRFAIVRQAGEAVAAFFEEQYEEALSADPLRAVTAAICEHATGVIPHRLQEMARRRDVPVGTDAGALARVRDLANRDTVGQVLGVLAELAAHLELRGWVKGYDSSAQSEVCEAAGVDLEALAGRLEQEEREEVAA